MSLSSSHIDDFEMAESIAKKEIEQESTAPSTHSQEDRSEKVGLIAHGGPQVDKKSKKPANVAKEATEKVRGKLSSMFQAATSSIASVRPPSIRIKSTDKVGASRGPSTRTSPTEKMFATSQSSSSASSVNTTNGPSNASQSIPNAPAHAASQSVVGIKDPGLDRTSTGESAHPAHPQQQSRPSLAAVEQSQSSKAEKIAQTIDLKCMQLRRMITFRSAHISAKVVDELHELLELIKNGLEAHDEFKTFVKSMNIIALLLTYGFNAGLCDRLDHGEAGAVLLIQRYFAFLDRSAIFEACMHPTRQWKLALDTLVNIELQRNSALKRLELALEKSIAKGDGLSCVEDLRRNGPYPSVYVALKLLPRIMLLAPESSAAYCVDQYPYLQPWFIKDCYASDEAYLAYMDLALGSVSQLSRDSERRFISSTLRRNSQLVTDWLELSLAKSAPRELSIFFGDSTLNIQVGQYGYCRVPFKDSHQHAWTRESAVLAAITQSAGDRHSSFELDTVRAIRICLLHGYWKGALRLLSASSHPSDFEIKVALLVHLGDVELLVDAVRGSGQWSLVWSTIAQVLSTNDGRAWIKDLVEPLALSSVDEIGSALTMQALLDASELIRACLTPRFFKACLGLSRLQDSQKEVVHEILTAFDAYLWTHHSSTISPQFRHLKDNELSGRASELAFARPVNGSLEPLFQHTVAVDTFMEEADTQWGVLTSVGGDCPACLVALAGKAVGAHVNVFPCGHAFHDSCNTSGACLLCFYSNRKSLSS